jgi:hypothetical protein
MTSSRLGRSHAVREASQPESCVMQPVSIPSELFGKHTECFVEDGIRDVDSDSAVPRQW